MPHYITHPHLLRGLPYKWGIASLEEEPVPGQGIAVITERQVPLQNTELSPHFVRADNYQESLLLILLKPVVLIKRFYHMN